MSRAAEHSSLRFVLIGAQQSEMSGNNNNNVVDNNDVNDNNNVNNLTINNAANDVNVDNTENNNAPIPHEQQECNCPVQLGGTTDQELWYKKFMKNMCRFRHPIERYYMMKHGFFLRYVSNHLSVQEREKVEHHYFTDKEVLQGWRLDSGAVGPLANPDELCHEYDAGGPLERNSRDRLSAVHSNLNALLTCSLCRNICVKVSHTITPFYFPQ